MSSRFILRGFLFVLSCALAAAGCEQSVTAPIDRDTFVEVMVELRKAQRSLPDSAAFDARRAEILAQAGVTDAMLMGFVRAYEGDVDFMASVWEAIDRQVNPMQPELTDDTAK